MMLSTQLRQTTKKSLLASLLLGFMSISSAQATIVQFQTVMGEFEVNLFDHDPAVKATVDNFLKYVRAEEGYGSYANTIVHRSVPGFVIQGGGFAYTGTVPPTAIDTGPRITNQPVYSNVLGTISMAKLGSSVDSATSQWFINLADNSSLLDSKRNGSFSAFGQVESSDMATLNAVVKAIAEVSRFNMGSPFNTIPLRAYTATDAANNAPVDGDNFVIITDIVILDANTDTAANLNPVKNTLVNKKDDSGGSMNMLLAGLLALLALGRKSRFNRG